MGDIPGLGKLFGTTQLTDNDTEMLFFITPKIVYNPKEQMEQIRIEELKKRPGDIPEFMDKMQEAQEQQKREFLSNSLRALFVNDR